MASATARSPIPPSWVRSGSIRQISDFGASAIRSGETDMSWATDLVLCNVNTAALEAYDIANSGVSGTLRASPSSELFCYGGSGSKDIEAREVLEEGQAQTGQIMSRADNPYNRNSSGLH
jgi:hypothetical protein